MKVFSILMIPIIILGLFYNEQIALSALCLYAIVSWIHGSLERLKQMDAEIGEDDPNDENDNPFIN